MKELSDKDFRAALLKIMPGYKWTVQKSKPKHVILTAIGIQSSGFNRLSTIQVDAQISKVTSTLSYTVRSAGYGRRAPWLGEFSAETLAQAFRGLQKHYELLKFQYATHESDIEQGRKEQTT